MGLYEFSSDDAYRFAREQYAETRLKGNELHFKHCPYCRGGKGGHDTHTFSINIENGQYKCLRASCDAHGGFVTLARDFDFSLGADMERYLTGGDRFRSFPKKKQVVIRDEAVEYMRSRGISEEVTKRYEITVQDSKPNILVFPFFDQAGTLRFVKYRKTDFDKNRDSNKEWCEKNCMPILFGMKQCNDKFDRLIITEGQIDSLSVAECGIENAVSVPTGALGFTWVPYVWDWFVRFGEIIVFGDLENGRITLLEELRKRFPGKIRRVRDQDYKDCKDANELLQRHGKQAVIDAVSHADVMPVKSVKRLADVQSVDIYSLPKLKTHIGAIDKLLGGLYFGQLVLLTGKRGEGKSTFMGQLLIEAIEQGYPVFVYSGELLDFYFKRWLDLQIAGPNHLIKNEHKSGSVTYDIRNSDIDKINGWYRDLVYLYDNNCIDDEEMENLLEVVEKSIQQYGIRLVCIDNLMTALDVGMDTDLYRAQSKFVGKLAKLAKKYNILILLVAHPRKNSGNLSNDDVSGSSDITNKVDVVMQYTRDADKEDAPDNERKFAVTKNRLTGRLTKSKQYIRLYYDSKSKRISDSESGFDREYGWNRDSDGFYDLPDGDMLPFS